MAEYELTGAAVEQRRAAAAARWGGRGRSRTIRVDIDAAESLANIPEKDRRQVASDGVRRAVREYAEGFTA